LIEAKGDFLLSGDLLLVPPGERLPVGLFKGDFLSLGVFRSGGGPALLGDLELSLFSSSV